MLVMKKSARLATLAAMIAADGVLEAAKFSLMQADISPTPNNVVADFGIAAFNGVAAGTTITWGTPAVNDDGEAEVLGQLIHLLTTSAPTDPVPIFGYVITNTAGDDWILAERFASPYIFNRNGQAFNQVPSVRVAN